MSRIGKLPIELPAKVEITVSESTITVKGPLGVLSQKTHPEITIEKEGNTLLIKRNSEAKVARAMHGLYRSLINNMVVGVSTGYEVKQELVGVGYRAQSTGQNLELTLGYSHSILFQLPPEIKVETKTERGTNPMIFMKSHDKQLLGQVAAKIRALRAPEPYKGKGIRFVGENIRRKAGKSAGK